MLLFNSTFMIECDPILSVWIKYMKIHYFIFFLDANLSVLTSSTNEHMKQALWKCFHSANKLTNEKREKMKEIPHFHPSRNSCSKWKRKKKPVKFTVLSRLTGS